MKEKIENDKMVELSNNELDKIGGGFKIIIVNKSNKIIDYIKKIFFNKHGIMSNEDD